MRFVLEMVSHNFRKEHDSANSCSSHIKNFLIIFSWSSFTSFFLSSFSCFIYPVYSGFIFRSFFFLLSVLFCLEVGFFFLVDSVVCSCLWWFLMNIKLWEIQHEAKRWFSRDIFCSLWWRVLIARFCFMKLKNEFLTFLIFNLKISTILLLNFNLKVKQKFLGTSNKPKIPKYYKFSSFPGR